MMRDASTYRSERRNDWRQFRYWNGDRAPWAAFNQPPNSEKGLYGSPAPLGLPRRPARSKYTPHNGKREMARRVTQLTALIDRYTTSIMANVSIIANDEAA